MWADQTHDGTTGRERSINPSGATSACASVGYDDESKGKKKVAASQPVRLRKAYADCGTRRRGFIGSHLVRCLKDGGCSRTRH